MDVIKSLYIINYIITPISVHDIQAVKELLLDMVALYVLADLIYLSKSLEFDFKEYHMIL